MNQTDMQAVEWYTSQFGAFEQRLNGGKGADVHALRKNALASFSRLGFPTTKHEEWKYTNVAPIARGKFAPLTGTGTVGVDRETIAPHVFGRSGCARLVFVNGRYSRELSDVSPLPAGVMVGSLAEAVVAGDQQVTTHLGKYATFESDAFVALNTAFLFDGGLIFVPDGVVVETPVHFLFVSTAANEAFVNHPRNLIVVGNNSQISIAETYVGVGKSSCFTNVVTEIVAAENAVIEHDIIQMEGAETYYIGNIFIHQKTKSNFTSNAITLGGALVRNNVTAVLAGEGCECTLNGLSLATGSQHVDNHTAIDHAMPHCSSHELYKSILDGTSRGVFNGKIFVRKDAQKTDAKQTNKTLVLSDDASIDTKPQLEIFADDVKCTHGATVGQLDEEQVFYLRSRGIGDDDARDILTFAFARDITDRVHVQPLRDRLETMIHERLQHGRRIA